VRTDQPVIVLLTSNEWISQAVVPLLEEHGYIVRRTGNAGGTGRSAAVPGDLLLVDEVAFSPGEAVGALRSVPVIVIGRTASKCRQIEALEAGADDYITVPCSPREFLARARAILRR
jgi:DNA-binding response OmpR family regulator